MVLWRIERGEHLKEALRGRGAQLFGGRWNPVGTAVVYLSTSLSLAAYERFVHADIKSKTVQLFAVGVEADEAWIHHARRPDPLPVDWRSADPPESTAKWGGQWAAVGETLLAVVPSVLLPLESFVHGQEFNLLLNPAHPDLGKVRVVAEHPFAFDARAWK